MSGFSFLKSTTVQSVHISSDVVFFIHSAEKMKPRLFSLEKTQTFFFEKKQTTWPTKKKISFTSSTNSQNFFVKNSWIGPWVRRID